MPVQHHRAASHSKKPASAHVRSSRPAPLFKRHSYCAGKASTKDDRSHQDDDDAMAVSFLQYCATCEKQIVVPNNSILYCSESCKRKDNQKTWAYTGLEHSPPPTPFGTSTFECLPVRDIVPPRSPTVAPSRRSSYNFPEIIEDHDAGSSFDIHASQDSEAARYLRQFQSVAAMVDSTGGPSRPRHNRSSASLGNLSTAPSLSHTPASTVSSSIPYTPSTRPLPPRVNPYSSSHGSRSIELVMPLTHIPSTEQTNIQYYSLKAPPSSKSTFGAVEGELVYEKMSTIPQSPSGQGSLKQLFSSSESTVININWD